MSQRIIS